MHHHRIGVLWCLTPVFPCCSNRIIWPIIQHLCILDAEIGSPNGSIAYRESHSQHQKHIKEVMAVGCAGIAVVADKD